MEEDELREIAEMNSLSNSIIDSSTPCLPLPSPLSSSFGWQQSRQEEGQQQQQQGQRQGHGQGQRQGHGQGQGQGLRLKERLGEESAELELKMKMKMNGRGQDGLPGIRGTYDIAASALPSTLSSTSASALESTLMYTTPGAARAPVRTNSQRSSADSQYLTRPEVPTTGHGSHGSRDPPPNASTSPSIPTSASASLPASLSLPVYSVRKNSSIESPRSSVESSLIMPPSSLVATSTSISTSTSTSAVVDSVTRYSPNGLSGKNSRHTGWDRSGSVDLSGGAEAAAAVEAEERSQRYFVTASQRRGDSPMVSAALGFIRAATGEMEVGEQQRGQSKMQGQEQAQGQGQVYGQGQGQGVLQGVGQGVGVGELDLDLDGGSRGSRDWGWGGPYSNQSYANPSSSFSREVRHVGREEEYEGDKKTGRGAKKSEERVQNFTEIFIESKPLGELKTEIRMKVDTETDEVKYYTEGKNRGSMRQSLSELQLQQIGLGSDGDQSKGISSPLKLKGDALSRYGDLKSDMDVTSNETPSAILTRMRARLQQHGALILNPTQSLTSNSTRIPIPSYSTSDSDSSSSDSSDDSSYLKKRELTRKGKGEGEGEGSNIRLVCNSKDEGSRSNSGLMNTTQKKERNDTHTVQVMDPGSSGSYTYSDPRAFGDNGTLKLHDSSTEESDYVGDGDGDSGGSDERYQKARATLFDLMYNTTHVPSRK